MNTHSPRHRLTILALLLMAAVTGYARRNTLRVNTAELDTMQMLPGSITIYSPCAHCHTGYNLDQVRFSGFDKVAESSKESFFITNLSDAPITSVSLYIEYLTTDGRQLHKRYVTLKCDIPAGETRRVDLKSWDTQKAFYYAGGRTPKRREASPFSVRFQIVSFDIRPH